jgi:hypothetical protein
MPQQMGPVLNYTPQMAALVTTEERIVTQP